MFPVSDEVIELITLLNSILSDILDRYGFYEGDNFAIDMVDGKWDHPNFRWRNGDYDVVWYIHPGRGTFGNLPPEDVSFDEFLEMSEICVSEAVSVARGYAAEQ